MPTIPLAPAPAPPNQNLEMAYSSMFRQDLCKNGNEILTQKQFFVSCEKKICCKYGSMWSGRDQEQKSNRDKRKAAPCSTTTFSSAMYCSQSVEIKAGGGRVSANQNELAESLPPAAQAGSGHACDYT